MTSPLLRMLAAASVLAYAPAVFAQEKPAAPAGAFDSHEDIGLTPKTGSVDYDASSGEYRVTGGGANVWASADAFHFLFKMISGDVRISADVRFEGQGAVNHRKAMLMVRQSLAPDAPYADIAVHGDGLTSLQYRPTSAAVTQEAKSTAVAPTHIQLERRGAQFTISTNKPGEPPLSAGPITLALQNPVYIGLAVCSHDAQVLETAIFSNVKIEPLPSQPPIHSKISIYDLTTKTISVIYESDILFEAPNWSPDGKFLLSNSGGALYRLPLNGTAPSTPEKLPINPDYRANNDHGFSPDGKLLAISARIPSAKGSQVYTLSADGSNPKLMTPEQPSYYHGWSPDGRWLAFVGQRDGVFNLFRVPVEGGPEQRLTSVRSYDDGPDYSPDGKWIYFNSQRSGGWDIWRIPAEGGGPEDRNAQRITSDEWEDWFPHPSPDGKWLAFLSFPKGTKGHNDRTDVQLRMMPLPGASPKPAAPNAVASIFGGQGTINVNSWSPDSKKFAFISYRLLSVPNTP